MPSTIAFTPATTPFHRLVKKFEIGFIILDFIQVVIGNKKFLILATNPLTKLITFSHKDLKKLNTGDMTLLYIHVPTGLSTLFKIRFQVLVTTVTTTLTIS